LTKFAFIIHPLYAKQAARKYPIAKYFPDGLIEKVLARKKPEVVSHITGVRSLTGAETEGWFIICPLTPRMMMGGVPLELSYQRITECAHLAADLGAEIIGLGAFTSVVGDGGITVAQRSKIAVTTGNSYTVATAIEGTRKACEQIGLIAAESTLAVVGATGSIGRTCATILAPEFAETWVIGRDPQRTEELAASLPRGRASTRVSDLARADAIITVTSAESDVVLPEHLKQGAIVCDVARPRDVSVRVQKERTDVLVIEGGVVAVPGDVDFGLDFGFPPRTAYACMSETMMLALDGRPENFTLGKEVSVEQVEETWRLAAKHGFSLSGFRSFERAVSPEDIERVRRARSTPLPPAAAATP